MKKITKAYRMFCPNCDHEFSYLEGNIHWAPYTGDRYVICPHCGSHLLHKQGNYMEDKLDNHLTIMHA